MSICIWFWGLPIWQGIEFMGFTPALHFDCERCLWLEKDPKLAFHKSLKTSKKWLKISWKVAQTLPLFQQFAHELPTCGSLFWNLWNIAKLWISFSKDDLWFLKFRKGARKTASWPKAAKPFAERATQKGHHLLPSRIRASYVQN